MVIAEWNGHSFEVSPQRIISFKDLKVTGSTETKKVTTSGKEQAVSVKNGNARNVTMTAILNYVTGCTNVQDEALSFVDEATAGTEAYLYVSGEKLFTCLMMLTKASVGTIEMAPNGMWTYAEVELTFDQSSKLDGQKKTSTSTPAKKNDTSGDKKVLDKIDINAQIDTIKKATEQAKTVASSQMKLTSGNQTVGNALNAVSKFLNITKK